MKFYYAPGSISIASLIVLYELDVDFEPVEIDTKNGEQTKPEYHKINPKGRVPALELPNGILSETPAILTYLAETNGALLPTGAEDRAQVQSWLSYFASTVHINHAHRFRGYRWADNQSSYDDMQSKVGETMTQSMMLVEEALTGDWLMGDEFTIADAHLFNISMWLEGDGADLTKLPRVMAHFARMKTRPAVQKMMELIG